MTPGQQLFARYAYAPNQLGYCGPADAAALFELGSSDSTGCSAVDITAIARRFSGAWPYAALLADLAGIDDPLDARVMRAYWTGSPLLGAVDRDAFSHRLVDYIATQAGQYWTHLNDELLPEVTATHAFHVFGVYPWSRLLTSGQPQQPLQVLDSCRIRWGRLISIDGDHLIVRSRHLSWDGVRLGLTAPERERVRCQIDGRGFAAEARPGDWLALHWDWVCERLTPREVLWLRYWTRWQLAATNTRLAGQAHQPAPDSVVIRSTGTTGQTAAMVRGSSRQ